MKNFLILFFLVLSILACNTEPNFPLEQIDFDIKTLSSKQAAWASQKINDYSYEFVYETPRKKRFYVRISVENNTVIGIENLISDDELLLSPDYNKEMEGIINDWGTITSIYERIDSWYKSESVKLKDKQTLMCKIEYNKEYSYPENVSYVIYTYHYSGNNVWESGKGQRPIKLALTNFQVKTAN